MDLNIEHKIEVVTQQRQSNFIYQKRRIER